MSTQGTLIDEHTFRRLCRARDFAASHLDQPLSVRVLAWQAALSQWHFHRLFTAAFGQTPHEFMSLMRLQKAKRLLASDSASVTEICLETGFSSLGSFSSWFRSNSGLAPSIYCLEIRRVFGVATPWRSTFIPTCFLAAFRGLE